ncbi:MAG: flavodoxin family protein [Anaerolineae bacterium]|nr:flavodoxin family protein [Anaerolineae bacterium]
MHTLVVYDSTYGHTERVARAMGEVAGGQVRHVKEVSPEDLAGCALLIIGSPTHGGWFTPEIKTLLEAVPSLEGIDAAVFDTRTASVWNRILPFGYAAPRIAQRLKALGAHLVADPEGFIVLGVKGPLKEGELERAAAWTEQLLHAPGPGAGMQATSA